MKNILFTVLLLIVAHSVSAQSRIEVNIPNPQGAGSLAEAILQANRDDNHDTIVFNQSIFSIPVTIFIPKNQPLPPIDKPVTIIGIKAPNGQNNVSIQSANPNETEIGLLINSPEVRIIDLCIANFKKTGLELTPLAAQVEINGCHLAGNQKAQILAKQVYDLVVENCFLGTDWSGQFKYVGPPGTTQEKGIVLDSCETFRVGTDNFDRTNVFGAFLSEAIEIHYCIGGMIIGNYIGVNKDGRYALDIEGNGILLKDNCSQITIQENVVVFCGRNGVLLENSSDIHISSNDIGYISALNRGAPNRGSGVRIDGISTNNQIGSKHELMNNIRYNNQHGIWITDSGAYNNLIYCNDLSCNKEKGISLSDGVTLVGNNAIKAPVFSSADQTNGIIGYASAADQSINVFATDPNCQGSCAGALMLGVASPNPNDLIWQLDWDNRWDTLFASNPNIRIVAVAIDDYNNTSEFSECKEFCFLKRKRIEPQYLCSQGDTVDVSGYFEEVNVPGGNPTIEYRWLFNNINIASTSVFVPQEEGTYTLEVSACNGQTKLSLLVDVYFSDFDVDGGGDQIIESGGSVQLKATVIGGQAKNISWLPVKGLTDPNSLNPIANPTVTTTYTITVYSADDCDATDTVTVSIESPYKTRWGLNPTGTMSEIPASLQVLPNGNVMATGSFNGSIDWGGTEVMADNKGKDVFILMADGDGNPRIGRKGGGMSVERVIGSTKDTKGNVWVVGTFSGSMVIAGETLVAEGSEDIFLIKLDGDGNPRIGRKGGGMSVEKVAGITSDKEDNIYITGTFSGKMAFGSMELVAEAPEEIFVYKLDGDGNPRIGRKGGGMSVEKVAGIVTDQQDNVHIVGSFAEKFDFQTAVHLTGTGSENLFALTLNKDLNAIQGSTAQTSSATARNRISKVTTDANGNIVIAGEMQGGFRLGNRLPFLPFMANADTGDVFVAMLNSNTLQPMWGRRFTGRSAEKISGLAVDKDNNIFVGGTFNDNLLMAGRPLLSKGGQDFFLTKMTPSGTIIWNTGGGSANNDTLASITADPNGGVYFMGAIGGVGNFMDRNFKATGDKDIFIVSIAPKTVSIDDENTASDNQELLVYPNPNKGQFSLALPEGLKGDLTINDLLGRTIHQKTVHDSDAPVNIQLPTTTIKGVYFISLSSEKGVWNGKIIIE